MSGIVTRLMHQIIVVLKSKRLWLTIAAIALVAEGAVAGMLLTQNRALKSSDRESKLQLSAAQRSLDALQTTTATLSAAVLGQGVTRESFAARLQAIERQLVALAGRPVEYLSDDVRSIKDCLNSLIRTFNSHSHSDSQFGFSQVRGQAFPCF